jgi:hypothetical protein
MTLTVCERCRGEGVLYGRHEFARHNECPICSGTGLGPCPMCGEIRRQGSRYCSDTCEREDIPAANEPQAPRRTVMVERVADTIPVLVDVDE